MGPIKLAALSGLIVTDSVIIKYSQSIVQQIPTPPVPAEATTFSGIHQMSSDLFLHPVFDVAKALTGVADAKVVCPAP
jgi:hypothetical protein